MNTNKAKILTINDLHKLRHPVPASILDTAGILADRYNDLKRHLKKIRKEWK